MADGLLLGRKQHDKSRATYLEQALQTPTRDADTAAAVLHNADQLYTAEQERRVLWKIDLMVLPFIAICYVFFYIDKTSLSYAALFGLKESLNLQGAQYSWLSSVFYFGFLAWALPTAYLLQRLPVAQFLGINIALWGVLLMLQAVSSSFNTLAALRVLSGAVEACADPAFMLITAMWYTRREQPIRIGLWYSANGLGISLVGLLGYGIGQIKGSLASWKYEFLFIGALCTAWGIILFLFLPDSPVKPRYLSDGERHIALARLRDNQTGVETKVFEWHQVREALADHKLYILFLLGVVCNIPNGGISNFGTLIIQGFGYGTLHTTLLQIPYGIIVALSILGCVYLNDRISRHWKRQTRCYFIILFLLPNIAGAFGLRFAKSDNHVARLMCYYLTGPYNAAFVMILSMSTSNIAGHTKKVTINAALFLGYCTGNIAGPFFYRSEQSPEYALGVWSMIVSHLAEASLVLTLRMLLLRENRRRNALCEQQGWDKGSSEASTAFADLTDVENWRNFRYVY